MSLSSSQQLDMNIMKTHSSGFISPSAKSLQGGWRELLPCVAFSQFSGIQLVYWHWQDFPHWHGERAFSQIVSVIRPRASGLYSEHAGTLHISLIPYKFIFWGAFHKCCLRKHHEHIACVILARLVPCGWVPRPGLGRINLVKMEAALQLLCACVYVCAGIWERKRGTHCVFGILSMILIGFKSLYVWFFEIHPILANLF